MIEKIPPVSGLLTPRRGAGIVFAALLLFYFFGGVVTISPGEFGVVVKNVGDNRGMQPGGLDTGWHWIEPFTYDVIVYNTRFQQYAMEQIAATTKDGQPISVDVSLEIGLESKVIPQIHVTIGPDWYEQIILPAARGVIREATATELSDHIYTGEGRSSIQQKITEELHGRFANRGFTITANLRDIRFINEDFVHTLEEKAKAAQKVVIEQRNAEAAAQEAVKVANVAEGVKQRTIKEGEAEKERLRLQGEGAKLQKEADAAGNLALAKAEAEGIRLKREAYGTNGADAIVSVEWAKNLGPNVRVYGVPTGAPGTSSYMFDEALKGLLSKGQ